MFFSSFHESALFSTIDSGYAWALGTFGLISSHNVATRWIRHNFDTSVCFDG